MASAAANACLPTIPAAPTNLSALWTANRGVQLTWTPGVPPGTEYRLERLVGAIWVEIATISADRTTFYDAAIVPGETYQYRLRAYHRDDNRYSAYSEVVSISIPQAVLQKIFLPVVLR